MKQYYPQSTHIKTVKAADGTTFKIYQPKKAYEILFFTKGETDPSERATKASLAALNKFLYQNGAPII